MDRRTRIGIVGLGDIGMMHLRGFELLGDQCEIGALCELSPDRMELARSRLTHSTPEIFDDYGKMLARAHIDAVVVGIPSYLHKEVAVAALEAGKDVFLEKPVAHTIENCDEIIRTLHKTDRILQIGLVYRYSNLYRTLGKMVERGDFGNVTMAYCKEYRENFAIDWFFHRDQSGGALLDKNCHHFDLFSWFIGSDPVRVQAMGGRHVVKGKGYKVKCSYSRDPGQTIDDPDIVDHAFVNVEYANGAVANLGLCMYQLPPVEGLQIGIMGDNGAHALATRDTELMVGGGPLGTLSEVQVDYENDNHGVGHIGCHTEHIEFLQCVRDRTEPRAHIFIGRDSMVVCLAAQRSIDERRDVMINEFRVDDIEKIRAQRSEKWIMSGPDPMPAPQAKTLDSRGVFFNIMFDLARLFLGSREKQTKAPVTRRFVNPLERIAKLRQSYSRYTQAARGLKARVGVQLPGFKPLVTEPDTRPLFPTCKDAQNIVRFSEQGLRKAVEGESIQRLVLSDKLSVEGDYSHILPYSDAFVILAGSLKEIL